MTIDGVPVFSFTHRLRATAPGALVRIVFVKKAELERALAATNEAESHRRLREVFSTGVLGLVNVLPENVT